MKRPLLLLSLPVAALVATITLASADSFDSDTATIKKAGPDKAKVMVDKGTYMVPVKFADGASWDNVKDHYEVDPSVVEAFKMKKGSISIGSDGTASFSKAK